MSVAMFRVVSRLISGVTVDQRLLRKPLKELQDGGSLLTKLTEGASRLFELQLVADEPSPLVLSNPPYHRTRLEVLIGYRLADVGTETKLNALITDDLKRIRTAVLNARAAGLPAPLDSLELGTARQTPLTNLKGTYGRIARLPLLAHYFGES